MKLTEEIAIAHTEELLRINQEERPQAIGKLIDLYDEVTDESITHLTDLCIHEELTDNRKNKMSLYEYPIMSDTQHQRRANGRHTRLDATNANIVEVPLEHAQNVAVNGKDYTLPVRNFTNPW